MAKKLHHIEIHPAENGGHTVQHHFHHEMRRNRDSHVGMTMSAPEPEHHVFGPHEGHQMLAHVANHLQIPESGPAETEPDGDEESEGAEGGE
jgi:hypothetical protein